MKTTIFWGSMMAILIFSIFLLVKPEESKGRPDTVRIENIQKILVDRLGVTVLAGKEQVEIVKFRTCRQLKDKLACPDSMGPVKTTFVVDVTNGESFAVARVTDKWFSGRCEVIIHVGSLKEIQQGGEE